MPDVTAISPSPASSCFYDEDRQGALSNAHVGVIGACPRPRRLTRVETVLNGHTIDDGLIRQAAATAGKKLTLRTICTATPPTVAALWRRWSSAACGPRLSKGARDAGEFPDQR